LIDPTNRSHPIQPFRLQFYFRGIIIQWKWEKQYFNVFQMSKNIIVYLPIFVYTHKNIHKYMYTCMHSYTRHATAFQTAILFFWYYHPMKMSEIVWNIGLNEHKCFNIVIHIYRHTWIHMCLYVFINMACHSLSDCDFVFWFYHPVKMSEIVLNIGWNEHKCF